MSGGREGPARRRRGPDRYAVPELWHPIDLWPPKAVERGPRPQNGGSPQNERRQGGAGTATPRPGPVRGARTVAPHRPLAAQGGRARPTATERWITTD